MATCAYCGSTIIFGGTRDGNLRFCNARCQQAGALLSISNRPPQSQVQERLEGAPGRLSEMRRKRPGGRPSQLSRVVGARPDPLEQFPAVVLPPLWPQETNGRRGVLPGAWLVGIPLGFDPHAHSGGPQLGGCGASAGSLQAVAATGKGFAHCHGQANGHRRPTEGVTLRVWRWYCSFQ
jgi:hypothetical protein